MTFPVHVNSREGAEIFEFLRDKLDLPDNVYEVFISMKYDDLIRITCSYYAKRKDNQSLINQVKTWLK